MPESHAVLDCVFLYYDEVEIATPLGSKTGKHKLGMYNFSVLCRLYSIFTHACIVLQPIR